DFVDADDVGMVEAGDRARLVLEAAPADLVAERFGEHDLDRHFAAERKLLAHVDRGHAARPDDAHQAIAGDLRQPRVRAAHARIGHPGPPQARGSIAPARPGGMNATATPVTT